MQASEIKALLEQKLAAAEVLVEGEGCDFRLTIISDAFVGLMPVKRQQLVYSHLNDTIASGAIHAVTMKTFTCAEWQARA